ncbi:MAG: hypothetical protein GC168_17180 [Candidatus Hydrogenedens sp.]|nr:hypothetical protein [Candidatus Hydrogenedens sp.]
MRKFISLFVSVMVMSGLVACGGPKGVVTLDPYLTETVCALGMGNQLLAISAKDDYPPETMSLQRIGN